MASPTAAWADFFLHHWELHREASQVIRLAPELSFYSSTANYDANGTAFVPQALDKYSRMQGDLTVTYGASPTVSLYGRLSAARITADRPTAPAWDPTTGLVDQTLGANIRLLESKDGKTSLHFQLQVEFPAYSNPELTQTSTLLSPFQGDATTDVTGGLFGVLPIANSETGSWAITTGAGYTHRSGGYSAAVPYSATLNFTPRIRGIYASGSVLGVYSLKTDSTDPTLAGAGASGSYAVGAINPSLLTLRGELGYAFSDRTSLHGSVARGVWGQNSPQGTAFLAGMDFRFGPTGRTEQQPEVLTPEEYGQANQGFVNYSLEAKVTRVSDRLSLIKIDKGSRDNVAVGQVFDIFSIRVDGRIIEAVARAKVTAVKDNEAALTVTDYFKEVWIEEGFIAKRLID